MQAATGDTRFSAAIEAITEYGLDRQNAGTWRLQERHEERFCIYQMEHLLRRDASLSVRRAAARVAVMALVDGASFDAVVKRVERAYQTQCNSFDKSRDA